MIVFTRDLNINRLRMAYNNDMAEFISTIDAQPKHADISIGSNILRIYPDPEGKFIFNFRPYVTALINTRYFEDTLQPAITTGLADEFIYNFTSGSLFTTDVQFSIALSNNTTDTLSVNLSWLAGVEQLGSQAMLQKSENLVLTPFNKDTTNHYYLKYWEGYPFDISLYTPGGSLLLKNSTTVTEQSFTVPDRVSRIVLSDGRTDETLETLLPMTRGYNDIKIMSSAQPQSGDKFLTLEKISYKCGLYLKWLNKYGGYSYWLFENTFSIDRSTKQLGELNRDYYNPEHAFARTVQIGKESQDSIKVIAELLTEEEKNIVEGIIDSPKIYMFTGRPFSQNGYRNWIEVTLKTTGLRIKNAKQPLTNFTFDLELPQRYTQTL